VSRSAAFLDREGTVNVRPPPHEYVTRPEDFTWLPGAREGIVRLARSGYAVAIVSNQRGVARGLVSEWVVYEIENRIQRDLAHLGCRIEAFRYCFHDVDEGCECRKPRPGMLLDLAESLDLDLMRSWMIGDMESDVQAGKAAGCLTVRLAQPSVPTSADLVFPSLDQASRAIADAGSLSARL
jgi:D-glycero-D-manno-heptose 1,7-bisphosphate phosphatase